KDRKTIRFYNDFINLPDNVQKKITDEIFPLLFTDPGNRDIKSTRIKNLQKRWRIKIDMYYTFTFDVNQGYVTLRCIGPIDQT
ncbi:MAG: hypothetical protein ACUZ8H_00725, partial [Candidatus Anammoxibacter sp.]